MIYMFSEGIAKFKKDDKYGCLRKIDGRHIIEAIYDEIGYFKEGVAKVKLNNKYGIIKGDGTELLPVKFDKIVEFGKLLKVYLYGRCQIVNNGEFVTKKYYDEISFYDEKILKCKINRFKWKCYFRI